MVDLQNRELETTEYKVHNANDNLRKSEVDGCGRERGMLCRVTTGTAASRRRCGKVTMPGTNVQMQIVVSVCDTIS